MIYFYRFICIPVLSRPGIIIPAIMYFIAVTLIGIWSIRRTRNAADFFIAGKRIGLVALAFAMMSTILSGFAFIGGPGLTYSVGMGSLFIIVSAPITSAMGCWILAKRLRLLAEIRQVYTIPDAIRVRYKSSMASMLSAIAILIGVIGYMGTNVLAMGLLMDAILGMGLGFGIIVGLAVMLFYAVAGGMIAGVYTDIFQGGIIAVASVAVFVFCIKAGGGMQTISETLVNMDPKFMSPWGTLPILTAISFYFVFAIGSLGQPHVVHKFYMLRDVRKLKWTPLLVSSTLMLGLLLWMGIGVTMRALVQTGRIAPLDNPDNASPLFLLKFTPEFLAGIVFSGIIAAIMSTTDSFVNIGAAVVTHDIPRALGRKLKNELVWGRFTVAVICILAGLTAYFSGLLVVFLGLFGWGLFASTLVPALAIGLNWERATKEAAIASISIGLMSSVILEILAYQKIYTLPTGIIVSAVSLILSMITFLVVSLITQGASENDIDEDVRVVMEI